MTPVTVPSSRIIIVVVVIIIEVEVTGAAACGQRNFLCFAARRCLRLEQKGSVSMSEKKRRMSIRFIFIS
jgi:hypothetical protein